MKRGPWLAGAAALAALALLGRGLLRPTPDSLARAKLATLQDILSSRNDNDPRLDRDFVGLSEQAKRLLGEKYRELPRERLNERGTIVYLLGKNIQSADDWSFFRAVVAEPPCMSLANCAAASAVGGEAGDDVTLAYPSLVALRQARRATQEGGSRAEARRVLEAALGSRAPAVTRLARTLDAGATAP